MKKKLMMLIMLMVAITLGAWQVIAILPENGSGIENPKLKVVTSFYPVYIAAKNVIGETERVELVNLTEYQTGCLHDYQLTTNDMRKLEDADLLLINGAGMETFIEKVISAYPKITIIDTSEGIELLENEYEHLHEQVSDIDADDQEEREVHIPEDESADRIHADIETVHIHTHEEDAEQIGHQQQGDTGHADEHNHGEYNGHYWLNPDKYQKQILNIAEGLSSYDPDNEELYNRNMELYVSKIVQLSDEMKEVFSQSYHKDIIIFHDSFSYLADFLGLHIAYMVSLDGESSLSAGDIADIVDIVNMKKIKVLFSEAQFGDLVASNIADETGARVYIIDSLVTGQEDADSYIKGMKENIEVLKVALFSQ